MNSPDLAHAKSLLSDAVGKLREAYAPYSKLAVASVLETWSGERIFGVNVENASYGLTVCAERVAIFSAITHGHREFRALAVTASDGVSAAPCGACRQVLAEFLEPTGLIIYSDSMGNPVLTTVADLLPASFAFRPI